MIVIVSGIGHNLSSIKYALQRLGVEAVLTDDPKVISNASRVILPGVGSANQAMANLREKGLVESIQQLEVPVLGICLGMQILLSFTEVGNTDTLNIIPGVVRRFDPEKNIIIPHMGWNQLVCIDKNEPLLSDIAEGSYCYFVHSFAVCDTTFSVANTRHGDVFASVIRKDNFYGVQFHPERSGKIGTQILNNFLAL